MTRTLALAAIAGTVALWRRQLQHERHTAERYLTLRNETSDAFRDHGTEVRKWADRLVRELNRALRRVEHLR